MAITPYDVARATIIAICEAIVEAINDIGPGGTDATTLMVYCTEGGLDAGSFIAIMDALVQMGRIRCVHHRYYPVRQ